MPIHVCSDLHTPVYAWILEGGGTLNSIIKDCRDLQGSVMRGLVSLNWTEIRYFPADLILLLLILQLYWCYLSQVLTRLVVMLQGSMGVYGFSLLSIIILLILYLIIIHHLVRIRLWLLVAILLISTLDLGHCR